MAGATPGSSGSHWQKKCLAQAPKDYSTASSTIISYEARFAVRVREGGKEGEGESATDEIERGWVGVGGRAPHKNTVQLCEQRCSHRIRGDRLLRENLCVVFFCWRDLVPPCLSPPSSVFSCMKST